MIECREQNTLTKSTKLVHALEPHLRIEGFLLGFEAFMTQDFVLWMSLPCSFGKMTSFGSSWISRRKFDVSSKSTEKARLLSCELGYNRLDVDGSGKAEVWSSIGTCFASGAFRGNLLDRESGKTKVSTARCSAF